MEPPREEIEKREEAALAPWALRSGLAGRPRPLDPEGRLFDYRTEFQRDRDRILHARAFRRLRLKAEGGACGPTEWRRDRLTHTLEVAQVARTLARALALNEDLAEAIALGHALGTPPFGRDGARALDEILSASSPSPRGGFHVPLQSLRIVDLLEKRYEHPGLNLTHDVREGILKQEGGAAASRRRAGGSGAPPAAPPGSILEGIDVSPLDPDRPPSLETQAVSAADRIASSLGDLDDALRSGEIEPGDVERLPLVRELLRRVGDRYPGRAKGKRLMKANIIHRGLTHLLVTATIQQSRRTLRAWGRSAEIEDNEGFLRARRSLPSAAIRSGPRTLRLFEMLREELARRLHATATAAQAASRARKILGALFEAYRRDPRLLDDYVLLRFKETAGGAYLRDLPAGAMETDIARRYHGSGVFLRLVSDHIAGMTDVYALSEHGRLFGSTTSPAGVPPLP